jgi:predicted acylesterase/phospholipase RssA/CRP-like cAMP-binding protein
MDASAILAQSTLFANLSPAALQRLAALCEPVELSGGETLFRIGGPADHLYIVVQGRLRAQLADGSIAGDITRLDPIGEIGLLSGENHGAEVYALRDSLLLRMQRPALLELLQIYPSALLEMVRVVVQRLRRNQRQAAHEVARGAQSLALIPATPGFDLPALARRLQQALLDSGSRVELIDEASVDAALGPHAAQTPLGASTEHHRLMAWLNQRESASRSLLYLSDGLDTPWTERCLRQADRILIVIDSGAPTQRSAQIDRLRQMDLRAPIDLLVLRPDLAPAGDISAWRSLTGAGAHSFLRPDCADDYASLARQLSGRALSLVLGGGGARGFAHIGLIRALEELKLPLDLTGGTSMGAFFAALAACGCDSREMLRIARDTFVTHNYLNDFVLPRVSLIRGRKFLKRLREIFGERRIEDLRKPYFAVSTNLSRASTVVLDSGPLAVWVGTSMSIPGVAPPVVWQGDLLVDGAVTNSLPTDVMQRLGRGPIIASDVSTEGGLLAAGVEGPDPEALLNRRLPTPISLIDILFRSASLTSESGVRMRAANADLYLRMPVSGVALFDWKRLDEIVERAYQHALPQLEAFKRETLG